MACRGPNRGGPGRGRRGTIETTESWGGRPGSQRPQTNHVQQMSKRKRRSRATNKVQADGDPSERGLIKAEPEGIREAPPAVYRTTALKVARSTLFSAELEAVIEIIARERVYRAMLAGLGRRLLMGPGYPTDEPPRITE